MGQGGTPGACGVSTYILTLCRPPRSSATTKLFTSCVSVFIERPHSAELDDSLARICDARERTVELDLMVLSVNTLVVDSVVG
jgi:hypothetical protein